MRAQAECRSFSKPCVNGWSQIDGNEGSLADDVIYQFSDHLVEDADFMGVVGSDADGDRQPR